MEAESHSAMNPEVYSCLQLESDSIFCIGFAEKAFQDRLNFDQFRDNFHSPVLLSSLWLDRHNCLSRLRTALNNRGWGVGGGRGLETLGIDQNGRNWSKDPIA